MASPILLELAQRYFVSDLPGATIPASRLRNILDDLQQKRSLTTAAMYYLYQQELNALHQFAQGTITYDAFCEAATLEQAKRAQAIEAERMAKHSAMLVRAAEQKARETALFARQAAARRERESNPKYIAWLKNKALRECYGIDQYVEVECFAQIMDILRRIDSGNRLTDDDILWLTTHGRDYYSEPLQEAFHKCEAEFYLSEYKRTGDPWHAVNASSHYRKCKLPKKAHDLLSSIPDEQLRAPKLRSAIATTHGGVMRDMERLDEALKLGEQANMLTPKDFRPCTLLGAVNFELGHYDVGRDWYEKATARGAKESSIDYDLRGIILRADQLKRKAIKEFLLHEDPDRYHWVNSISNG